MLVTIVVTTLIALYAAFVIFRVIKKRRDAKKSGKPVGCAGCSCAENCNGGNCSGCGKKQ